MTTKIFFFFDIGWLKLEKSCFWSTVFFQFENFWEICVKFFLPNLEKDADINYFLIYGHRSFCFLFKGCLLLVFLLGLWLAVKWKLKADYRGWESQVTGQESTSGEVKLTREAAERVVWEGALGCGLAVRNLGSHLIQNPEVEFLF